MTGICNKMTVLSAHVRGLRFGRRKNMSPLDETARYLEAILGWEELDAMLLSIAIHAARSITEANRAHAVAILSEAMLTKW
jgi:hypothetical protein